MFIITTDVIHAGKSVSVLVFTKFGNYFLATIIKIVLARRQIQQPKCTKINFGWGSVSDPICAFTQRSPKSQGLN